MIPVLSLLGGLSSGEILIVMILGLLLFGSKFPEVGRSLGRSLMEFKKGLKGFTDDVESAERETERLIQEAEERERRRRAERRANLGVDPAAADAAANTAAVEAAPTSASSSAPAATSASASTPTAPVETKPESQAPNQ